MTNCSPPCLVVKAVGLTFFKRGRINMGYHFRIGNGSSHLILDSEQDGGLHTVVLDGVHRAGRPGIAEQEGLHCHPISKYK